VTAILDDAKGRLVGTDLGLVQLGEGNKVTPLAELGNVTSLARFQGKVYAGLFTGQVVEVSPLSVVRRQLQRTTDYGLRTTVAVTLWADDDRLWAVTSQGIYSSSNPGADEFKRFDQLSGAFQLSAAHVSALAVDARGRLWVGYFDRGIDVIEPGQPKLIAHIEGDVIREVNFLHRDDDERRMLAATSAGLVMIDERLRERRFTDKDGLISNSVSHVIEVPADLVSPRADGKSGSASWQLAPLSHHDQALVAATGAGLSVYADGVFRSVNAFHGLASNHLYTSARIGNRLFVGSLNGLNELEGLRVVRTFQTANSRLSHNWVSALAVVGSTLYIGTYGGGVDALLASGEMVNFAGLIGKFDVNPNAMHFDGERLYVGTLSQGVWMLDVRTDTWSRFTQGLSATNVTAITSDAQAVYFGTDHGLTVVNRGKF
jgi:ligand-binding sensor domain-containing protein